MKIFLFGVISAVILGQGTSLKCFECYWQEGGAPGSVDACKDAHPDYLASEINLKYIKECPKPTPGHMVICRSTFAVATVPKVTRFIMRNCDQAPVWMWPSIEGCHKTDSTICNCDKDGCNTGLVDMSVYVPPEGNDASGAEVMTGNDANLKVNSAPGFLISGKRILLLMISLPFF